MAIAHVASTVAATGPNGGSTSGINTTGATLLVVGGSWYDPASSNDLAVNDFYGNTWSPLTSRTEVGGPRTRLWYCASPIVGSGHTATVGGTGVYPTVWFGGFSGTAASPFDQESGSSSGLTPGSLTPSQDGCLLVTAATVGGSADLTAPTGYTGSVAQFAGGNNMGGGGAYLIQGTAAASNPSWTCSSTGSSVLGVFKAASGGGGGGLPTGQQCL